jgi:hypothetical protein
VLNHGARESSEELKKNVFSSPSILSPFDRLDLGEDQKLSSNLKKAPGQILAVVFVMHVESPIIVRPHHD